MRLKLPLTLALLTLCAPAPSAAVGAHAQEGQGDQKVIEDFVTTRGVTFETPAKRPAPQTASRPSPQQQPAPRPPSKGGAAASAKTAGGTAQKGAGSATHGGPAKKGGAQEPATKKQPAGKGGHDSGGASDNAAVRPIVSNASADNSPKKAIGLGVTLFVRQGENLIAADPSREFRQGDRLRIALETNTDGYLYIFHTENGRNPQMIFPNPAVDEGRNFVSAHARDFYPTDLSAWFEFDEVPATERLYFVVSRAPLAGVPTGRDLLNACGGAAADCLWKPTPQQWERIKAGAQGGVVEGRNKQLAQLQSPPPAAMTRGIKVKKDEPAPALVRVNDSAAADLFVTTIDLIHK
jgi:hypothetical protein